MRRFIIPAIPMVLAGSLILGCHERKERVVTHVERTEVVEEAPPGEVVVVEEAPPPIIVERRPPPPAGMVWVDGYWIHDHHHYVWYKGRYVRPQPGHRHVPAHWEHGRRGWEFHGEHWERHH